MLTIPRDHAVAQSSSPPSQTQKSPIFVIAIGLLLSWLIIAPVPYAQSEPEIEEIVVTGSRIDRDEDQSPPFAVQHVSEITIRDSGEYSLAEVMKDIPALLRSVTSEQSKESGFSDGANVLDLRGLGAERTLVLVDGHRHVGGLQGTSSVDIGSIPVPLVKHVDVFTGGASAIYGADAVTGVVNFVLRDDFDGFMVNTHYGISEHADAEQVVISSLWGRNLLEDRANVTVVVDHRSDDGLKVTDRTNGFLIGSARDWVNPDLRFQRGDIGDATPNFFRYYNYSNTGLIHYGLPIPTREQFIANYTAAFGTAPQFTPAELDLFRRAATAPQRAILPSRTFPFTSGYGYVVPGNPFTFEGFDPEIDIDLDQNGIPDCLDSFTGYNSVFGAASYGALGGCWNIDAEGNYLPVRDGLVAGNFQGFGGDSFNALRNMRSDLLVPEHKTIISVFGNYDLNSAMHLYGEFKYATQETRTNVSPTSFWDLLLGAPDNPFLPDFLKEVAQTTGGVAITIDPIFFHDRASVQRETIRFVGGVEGIWSNGWSYDVSINYGQYHQDNHRTEQVIVDRWFAAIDAVTDPVTGLPACRSEVDTDAPPMNTPFQIPAYEAGYFSFTPGVGECVPLNIWAGERGVSSEARNWVTRPSWSKFAIDQQVFSLLATGPLPRIRLPGGSPEMVVGFEFRRESANTEHDAWQRGVIPEDAPYSAGTMLSEISENSSLMFRPQLGVKNESGEYDARDFFIEMYLPLFSDVQFARELSLNLAGRWSNYSTIGSTSSWMANASWVVVKDLAIRGSVSRSVRAPNITELFGPAIGTNFRPIDPCDATQIQALQAEDPGLSSNFLNNCIEHLSSIGVDPFDDDGAYSFSDPLSASFGGIVSGNPNLLEESADTITYGFEFRPSSIPGLRFSVDVWEIEIQDAIESVTAQNIVDGCYRGTTLNQSFCSLFSRNNDPASAQFGGFNFLRTVDINFASLKTSGIDFATRYEFDIGEHRIDVELGVTKVAFLDFHTNPANPSDVDPELGEINRPEFAANVYLRWNWKNLGINWHAQYLGDMLLRFLEIETAETLYGDTVFQDRIWLHDANGSYLVTAKLSIHAGIRNLTDEQPFITNFATPASPRGRMFYLRAIYRVE